MKGFNLKFKPAYFVGGWATEIEYGYMSDVLKSEGWEQEVVEVSEGEGL